MGCIVGWFLDTTYSLSNLECNVLFHTLHPTIEQRSSGQFKFKLASPGRIITPAQIKVSAKENDSCSIKTIYILDAFCAILYIFIYLTQWVIAVTDE